MYKLSEIKDVHLEITSKCNARCPMCPRTRLLYKGKEHLLKDEITIELFKKWFPIKLADCNSKITLAKNLYMFDKNLCDNK
jgi:hypothetical protein